MCKNHAKYAKSNSMSVSFLEKCNIFCNFATDIKSYLNRYVYIVVYSVLTQM